MPLAAASCVCAEVEIDTVGSGACTAVLVPDVVVAEVVVAPVVVGLISLIRPYSFWDPPMWKAKAKQR